MDVFWKILENPIIFLQNHDFPKFGLGIFLATRGQTLVQHPGQTIRPRTIKIGMNLPDGTAYGCFFENSRKFNHFSQKSRLS